MKKTLRSLMLVTALGVLIPAAARPVDPLPQCGTTCSCRTKCGTPCRKSDGTPSACGISGNLCQISPVCFEP
ncbi:MAG: hypothetical protein ACJ76N_13905 [Thermoanaerobaculia bacterium]